MNPELQSWVCFNCDTPFHILCTAKQCPDISSRIVPERGDALTATTHTTTSARVAPPQVARRANAPERVLIGGI